MSLDDLVHRRPPAITRPPTAAVVSAITAAGVFVTPVGQRDEDAIGPCRGPRSTGVGPIAAGMHVLLVFAADLSPWIVSIDE